MKSIPPIVFYTVLRLVAFAVPLAVFLLIGFDPIMSTIIAALIGLSVSILLLRRPRNAVSEDLYRIRHGDKAAAQNDEDAEDAAVEDSEQTGAGPEQTSDHERSHRRAE